MLLLALLPTASAQQSLGGLPPSLDPYRSALVQQSAPRHRLPPLDLEPYLAEDAVNAGRKDIPWRFGVRRQVDFGVDIGGQWTALPDGSMLWRQAVRSPGAKTLNLQFDAFDLPPGARLWVHSPDGQVQGAFTEANHNPKRSFATGQIDGDEVILEYWEPADAAFRGRLHLSNLTHGYRGLDTAAPQDKVFGEALACNDNAACATGWERQTRSVVLITVGGDGFCTGALINNTNRDGTPYILTANHCLGGDPSLWIYRFNWQSPTCANPATSPAYDEIGGSFLVASTFDSDFGLLQLFDPVPPSFNAYFSGWDATGAIPQGGVGIHHPTGDIKKISFENSPLTSDDYNGGVNTHWRINEWDEGTTEGGSSGSPLFDLQSGRIIGQLQGGDAGCNVFDWFGKLSRSWDDGVGPTERLQDWLAPGQPGTLTLDGYDPNTPTGPLDASVVAITRPSELALSCTAFSPEVTLSNRGTDPLTSVGFQARIDSEPFADVGTWTGNLSTNAIASVELSEMSTTPGPHLLEVRSTDPNGQTDPNPGNDSVVLSIQTFDDAASFPIAEGFEGPDFPPPRWVVGDYDLVERWRTTSTAASEGSTSIVLNNYDEDFEGEEDWLISEFVDLSNVTDPVLSFDVAYAPYDVALSDELRVSVSMDCAESFFTVYDKAGSELATAPEFEGEFVPTAADWRTETIDLSSYAGRPVQLAFVNISGYGNLLYIDNIQVTGTVIEDTDVDTDTNLDTDVDTDTGEPPAQVCGCSSKGAAGGWLGLGLAALLSRRR